MKRISVCSMVSILALLLIAAPGCQDKPSTPQSMAQYDQARELARQGEFASAEQILNDLVKNQPDSEQAKLAAEYLRFEYPLFKAARLIQLGQHDEAETILKPLLEQNLSLQERTAVQGQLDAISTARVTIRQMQTNRTAALCRELQIELILYYQQNGTYPPDLNMEDWFPGNAAIRDGLSAIENFQARGEQFSFDATGRDNGAKFHVTNETIDVVK